MNKRSLSILVLITLLFPLLLTSCFDSTKEEEKKDDTIIDTGGDDFLDGIKKDSVINEAQISLDFDVLIEMLRTYENFNDFEDIDLEDFSEIATSFAKVIKANPKHVKANVGYAVSRIAMLNKNEKIQELADSIDRYISDWEIYNKSDRSSKVGSFSKSYKENGINGLGLTLFANSSNLIRSNTATPSFPKYITINKIQELIESEVMPALNGAILAFENIEALEDGSLTISVDGERVELDLGEILLADAALRLTRHSLSLLTTYNFDIQTPDGQDLHKVIDDYIAIVENGSGDGVYFDFARLSADGDTLFYYSGDSSQQMVDEYNYAYDLIEYNLKRADFLTIKRENHARMYADIKAVPEKIIAAISYITDEKDDQEDDLLKIVNINDLDADMVSLAEELKTEGLSSALVTRFKSPQNLATFINEILTSKYEFDETIDGIHHKYDIDLSKFYTNPVKDLREWLPLYTFNGKSNSLQKAYRVNYAYYHPKSSFSEITNGTKADFDMSLIESVSENANGLKTYIFKKSTYYYGVGSIKWDFTPVSLVDLQGNKIVTSLDDIDSDLLSDARFPHFKDYTFNGIFPDMTRARWIKLAQDIDGSL